MNIPRVLSIAGTDPTGGAGIQADLKSIAAAGGYGMCVITALVAQNTQGVREVHAPPLEFLRAQLDAVSDDVEIDAIKIGMLGNEGIIGVVEHWLRQHNFVHSIPVVLDPVMISTSGHRLLDATAEDALTSLASQATVITPNLPELALLSCNPPRTSFSAAIADAQAWLAALSSAGMRTPAVIVKGGHLTGNHADNAVVTADSPVHRVANARISTRNTHGTGCSLSSALATRLGRGDSLEQALEWSTAWLHESIAHADALQVGAGAGPIDHLYRARKLGAAD